MQARHPIGKETEARQCRHAHEDLRCGGTTRPAACKARDRDKAHMHASRHRQENKHAVKMENPNESHTDCNMRLKWPLAEPHSVRKSIKKEVSK